jgi:nitroreductase
MDTLLAIQTRRSIRRYTDQSIGEEKLDIILRAAMAAPSAGNSQSWRFVVVDDKKLLASIASLSPYAAMASAAPMAIIICADLNAEKYPDFWPQDCAAAMQNMLLAAHAQGLGAVWCGIHPEKEREAAFSRAFSLPDNYAVFGVMVLGHPADTPPPADRFDMNKVCRNRYE